MTKNRDLSKKNLDIIFFPYRSPLPCSKHRLDYLYVNNNSMCFFFLVLGLMFLIYVQDRFQDIQLCTKKKLKLVTDMVDLSPFSKLTSVLN